MKIYVSNIKRKIDDNFVRFDTYLENEKKEIDFIENKQKTIENDFLKIKKELSEKLNEVTK